jgi:hypothetical protein
VDGHGRWFGQVAALSEAVVDEYVEVASEDDWFQGQVDNTQFVLTTFNHLTAFEAHLEPTRAG